MRWVTLIAGVVGVPFTGCVSLLVGAVGFIFLSAGERVQQNASQRMFAAKSKADVDANGCGGAVVLALLLVLAVVAMLAVGGAMVGGGL